jgi:hypothetical protein
VTDADDATINTVLDRPEAQGRIILAARYGKITVFRITALSG